MANLVLLPRRVDREWFDQRQRGLVELADTWWGREFLRLPGEVRHLPIVGIGPSWVRGLLPTGEYVSVFSTRPRYARRIQRFAQWEQRYGTLGAQLRASDPRLQMIELAVATESTFNPDASPESTSVDGFTSRQGVNETWATIRGAAGTSADDTGAGDTIYQHSCSATTNQYSLLRRSFFLFDTSSLPDGDAISAAVFSVHGTSVSSDNGAQNLALVTTTPASNTAIVASDHLSIGTTRQSGADVDISAWNASGYNDWTLDATGRGNISKTGVSKFGVRGSGDLDNSAPAWVSGQVGSALGLYADNGTNKPKLVVTHAPVGGFLGRPLGPVSPRDVGWVLGRR